MVSCQLQQLRKLICVLRSLEIREAWW